MWVCICFNTHIYEVDNKLTITLANCCDVSKHVFSISVPCLPMDGSVSGKPTPRAAIMEG